jgi:ribosomal protein L20A (L18A)
MTHTAIKEMKATSKKEAREKLLEMLAKRNLFENY